MNLVVIAALIAVASAAKLDRTYLPPPSAKTAGGSPGALQTPFASNSFNNGLGGIPKGGFENDFKGVVVDAAAPGTRASGDGETGLGAPRTAYGSTNSKVGDAAFRGSPAGFRGFPQQNQFENQQSGFRNQQNHIPDGATAGTNVNAQSFVQGPGNFQGSEPTYQRSQELNARDAAASIVRFDSDVGTDSFSYSFETDNGISAEESGVATNGVQAQGGFSYTGDDGQVYSVTYTADEGGYQPKGDHLPTPPPIPEEILKSLEQNARDEAAGLVDDGSYDAQKYNAESDYTENDGGSTHNGRQPAQFGNRPESDASASGTFINQNNQPFVRPSAQAGVTGQGNTGSTNFGSVAQAPNGQAQFGNRPESDASASGTFINQNNKPFVRPSAQAGVTGQGNTGSTNFGSVAQAPNGQAKPSSNGLNGFGQLGSNKPNAFGQPSSVQKGSNGFVQATSISNTPGQAVASSNGINGFVQNNQAVSGFQQNKPSFNGGAEDSENANTFVSPSFETFQNVIQGQEKPQQSVFGRPKPNSQSTGQSVSESVNSNNPFGPSSNNLNAFGQRQTSSQNGNGLESNEYLPPVNSNRRPVQSTPQRQSSFGASDFNQFSQVTNKPEDSGASSSFVSSAQSTVDSQRPQFGSFQNNQLTNNQKPTTVPASQSFAAVQSNKKPLLGSSQNTFSSGQVSGSFSPFKQQQSTAEPVTELTTPFEGSPNSNGNTQSSGFGSFGAQSSQGRPTQSSFGSQFKGSAQFTAPAPTSASALITSSATFDPQGTSSRPSDSNIAPSSSFSNQRQSSSQHSQENKFGQSESSAAFSQNKPDEVQFASSTQRPTFSQNTQAQGPDDSYYYNQPSKAFNTPNYSAQGSRFPNTPFNQFDRVTKRPLFQSNAQASVTQQNFPGSSFSQNGQSQGSTRYPQPPTLSSVAPTSPTRGSTAASFNGITQSSASSFSSGAPTSSSPFGSQNTFSGFGRRPAQQQNSQFNNQGFGQSSSSQQGLGIQTTATPQSFSNQQQNNFQNQPASNTAFSPAAPSQQYQGEIYEYTKPAQTLPPPTEQDKEEGFGQFGNPAKFQTGQQTKPQLPSDSQSGQSQGRPQFATQPSRPQFGQKTQTSQQTQFNAQSNSRPQFGQQTTSFGNAQSTQALAFAQTSNVQEPQPSLGDKFSVQNNLNAGFQSAQPSQFSRQPQEPQSQERPRPPCCKRLPSASQTNQFVSQSQGQFGSSDVTTQDFKTNQDSAQSLAGKGEVFGGPRKPPSFDEQTGYHY